jgi:protein-S-isoprenylcysteine O-methyltransferase Ste14
LVFLSSLIAFILLIYAVDCIDTMFNIFKSEDASLNMTHYFYEISRKEKYYGMLCIIISLLLFVGSILPSISAFGVGLLLSIGYRFWYPEYKDDDMMTTISKRGSFTVIARVVFCIFPLFFIFRGDGF